MTETRKPQPVDSIFESIVAYLHILANI